MLPRSGPADLVVFGDVLRRMILLQCRDQHDPKKCAARVASLPSRSTKFLHEACVSRARPWTLIFLWRRSESPVRLTNLRAHLAEAFTNPAT